MKNPGKVFEEDIKESIPQNCTVQRLKDGSTTGTSDNPRRIKTNNPCDFIVFDDVWYHMWELKSHQGNSFPLTPVTKDTKGRIKAYGVIKKNQIDGMMNEYGKKNREPGFIFNFRDKDKTFFVSVKWVHQAVYEEGKKSLSLEWCEQHGTLIKQYKKFRSKIHWEYDLSVLLDN